MPAASTSPMAQSGKGYTVTFRAALTTSGGHSVEVGTVVSGKYKPYSQQIFHVFLLLISLIGRLPVVHVMNISKQ